MSEDGRVRIRAEEIPGLYPCSRRECEKTDGPRKTVSMKKSSTDSSLMCLISLRA